MVHRIIVEDQSLRWYGRPPKIADDSIEFVQLQFHLPEEWASLLLVAQFTQSETYNMLMTDDRCFLPVELKAGLCKVSLFGYSEGKPVRATSIPLVFQIEESGFVSSGETPIPPTPDLYAQLIEYFSSIAGSGGGDSGGGTINPEDIAAAVEDYLSKNPPEVPDLSDEVDRAETAASEAESASKDASASANNAGSYATYAKDSATSAASSAALAEEAASDAEAAAVRAEEAAKVTTDLDTTLTQEGKAADAKAVGDAISKLSGGNVDLTGVVKSVNGVTPDENGNVKITVSGGGVSRAALKDGEYNVLAINHRGYSTDAPENTIPAYIMSKEKGFNYVEADVQFTSDGVAVLLHDATIDRTSNGSGSISAMTYAEASKYDYGSWKNTKYTGTRIPTFEEFIVLCKRIGLHPYIELKQNGSYTEAQIQPLVAMVKNCGMDGKVTWISFSADYLRYVKTADSSARLGYLVSSVTSAVITTAQGLQTDTNEVFIDSSDYDADAISLCRTAGLPLEIWTINSSSIIQNMNAYITGVTSDNLIAGKILHDAGMVYEYGIDGDEPVVPDEPEKTLTSISATYSGGEVAVGTAVSALTGIVVTAYYSDGSSESVTGYTLSGTIAEGSNTITVTYEGKTATFIVIGKASEYTPIFEFSLVQGRIDAQASTGYLYPGNNRVSYIGTDCALTPGKRYRLLGVNDVKYGVQTITETGYAKIQSGSDLGSGDKLDSGWQESGYEFVADSRAVCAWLTASFTSGDITPEQAMPVYLEELDDGNVGDDTRTLLYNWDFTNSLVDTVNGEQATLIGNATQTANGLTITDGNSGAKFDAIAKKGMTIEVDIADGSTITNPTANGRLLCFSKYDGNRLDKGVVWRGKESAWNTYSSGWGTAFSDDPALFSGKTMTVVIRDDKKFDVYSGGKMYTTSANVTDFDTDGYVSLGSAGTSAAGMVITAMRIYDGAHSIPQE